MWGCRLHKSPISWEHIYVLYGVEVVATPVLTSTMLITSENNYQWQPVQASLTEPALGMWRVILLIYYLKYKSEYNKWFSLVEDVQAI